MSLLAEPPKSGVKEKRKKAASFQTVSQLHKVRPSRGPTQALTCQSPAPSLVPALSPAPWAGGC